MLRLLRLLVLLLHALLVLLACGSAPSHNVRRLLGRQAPDGRPEEPAPNQRVLLGRPSYGPPPQKLFYRMKISWRSRDHSKLTRAGPPCSIHRPLPAGTSRLRGLSVSRAASRT